VPPVSHFLLICVCTQTVINAQRTILRDVQGTNVWSGQQVRWWPLSLQWRVNNQRLYRCNPTTARLLPGEPLESLCTQRVPAMGCIYSLTVLGYSLLTSFSLSSCLTCSSLALDFPFLSGIYTGSIPKLDSTTCSRLSSLVSPCP
jgi:hypothetical protein